MSSEPQVAPGPEVVDRLADEFLGRYRLGQRPSITEYVQAHPDLAHEIRELFPTLVVLERLSPRQDEIALSQTNAAPAAMPQQLGEYRILREVGRGGMGVVYEAEQLPLGRHVALKVLLAAAVLSPSVLTRFQNEVRAAARLHHTNIVPVFGVGEDSGTHYYAMQFITGRGLDVVLDELRKMRCGEPAENAAANPSSQPSASSHGTSLTDYFQGVARMGLQVAEALAHAHSQGVLHRDIKPSNLLLDAQGTVWVTDFGLAKQAGCDVTGTGDVVGTLRYMAPERFGGASDASSDIYGLGVTLYELLTTEPAFRATDRAQLVHDIAHSEPPPIRRLERRVPRDLETIVLKAMAKRPAERYATAAEMAADLRRFLDDKPIAARRLGAGERLWRWCVRRPALASLAAALIVSLVVGVAGVCWQWARAEMHLKEAVKQQSTAEKMLGRAQVEQRRAEQNLAEAGRQETIAKREAARAEDNFQTARRSVNELLTLVSEDDLSNEPGLQPLRLRLLTKAIEFHEQMLADRQQDAAARRDLAQAYYRLGRLRREMGPASEAAAALERAITLLEAADAAPSSDHETALLLVRLYNTVAVDQNDLKHAKEAQRLITRARERIDRVLAEEPSNRSAQQASAMTFNNQAYLISDTPQLEVQSRMLEAIALHEQALTIYRRLAKRRPDNQGLKLSIAFTLSNIGRRNTSLGLYDEARYDEAQRLLEEVLAIRQELSQSRPQSLSLRFDVAGTYNALGDIVLWSRDRSADKVALAAVRYQQALAIQEPLARENPAVLMYWQHLAGTLENLNRLYGRSGDRKKALHWRRQETVALKTCLDLEPENIAFRARWATQLEGQATLEADLGLLAESLATRREVREAFRPIHKQPEEVLRPHRDAIRRNLARLMVELGMQDQPAELYEVALERHELRANNANALFAEASALQKSTAAATRAVNLDDESRAAAVKCQQLAVALFRQAAAADPSRAAELARAQQHMQFYAWLGTLDAQAADGQQRASLFASRARILRLIGDSAAAQADFDRALALLDAALQDAPADHSALRQRTGLHLEAGHWEQLLAEAGRVLADNPDDAAILECRAHARFRLCQWQQALDDYARAAKLRPERISFWPLYCLAAFEAGQVEEARANAGRLVELAGDDVVRVNELVWALLAERAAGKFPDQTLALARRSLELATQARHERTLGGVYCHLGRHREAVEALAPAETAGPGESAAFANFWLAISLHHLGEHERARRAFQRGVRNWKGAAVLTEGREDFLRATWQEAHALLFGSETPAARS
jgi:tetratricopeptide (TPR) repeat protein